MKKIVVLMLIVTTMLFSGCAKGEITLEISRWGAADVECKLVAVPVLVGSLNSFADEFKEDGYKITPTHIGEMEGFQATKHYAKVSDIKDSKVLETFRFAKLKQAMAKRVEQGGGKESEEKSPAVKAPQPEKSMVTVQEGLLFDEIKVKTGLNLEPDDKESLQSKFLLNNVFKQIDLKFIVKLPTKVDSSDATTVSDDGKTLTWNLALGEQTPINATLTYLNPIKAASWAGLAVLLGLGYLFYRSYKKHKAQGVKQDEANAAGNTK